MLTFAPDIASYLKEHAMTFDDIMQLEGTIFRNMDGRITRKICLTNTYYYIKQHHGVGYIEIIKNLLQFKIPIVSARNEWLALHRLKEAGVSVPNVLGLGEEGINPATRRSFVLLEAIEPSISLDTLTHTWRTRKPSFAFKRALIEKIADITATMHALGINHRDLYICHFLLKKNNLDDVESSLYLIDLHRAQIRAIVPMRWRVKDLAALYFSSLHIGLTKRDRLRFMKRYKQCCLRETLKKDYWMWHHTYLRGEKLNRDHQ